MSTLPHPDVCVCVCVGGWGGGGGVRGYNIPLCLKQPRFISQFCINCLGYYNNEKQYAYPPPPFPILEQWIGSFSDKEETLGGILWMLLSLTFSGQLYIDRRWLSRLLHRQNYKMVYNYPQKEYNPCYFNIVACQQLSISCTGNHF